MQKSNGKLIIVTGLPGAGKTTFAKKMIAENRADCYYEADMWMVDGNGDYKFEPEKLGYCHNQCFLNVSNSLQSDLRVIQCNTNLTRKEVEKYISKARELGCAIEIIHLTTEYGSVHGVPKWKMNEMRKKRQFFSIIDF